jgi:DNA-binding NarL/FixJ family response regulator
MLSRAPAAFSSDVLVRGDSLTRRQATLTTAEADVLDLVRQGLSNKEIAAARGRSVATVKHQLQSVFGKCGVNSRTRLIVWSQGSSMPPSVARH